MFTKLLKPVLGFLCQMGIRLIIYLDDILIIHQAKDQLELLVPQVHQLLKALGLLINKKKSLLIPAQCLEFLGFQICSHMLMISVPKEKLRKISRDAYRLLHQTTVSVRELARFVVKAVATVRGISVAPLYYRALQRLINSVSLADSFHSPVTEKFNVHLLLSQEARADLMWWAVSAKEVPGNLIFPPVTRISIESDASNLGWGPQMVRIKQEDYGQLWNQHTT